MRPRHQATLMQPLQSDLQIPNCKTQKNYAQRHEKLQLQNRMDLGTKPKKNHPCSHYHAICIQNIKGELSRLRSKRSKPHPAHTRGTFHRRLQPLDTEKHKVLCSGFLPKTNPMQQSCSCHYNAFCSNTYPSMQPLQCDWHPHVAEHQGRTDYARNDPTAPAAHTRYDSSPAVATLHGKTEGFVLRLPPQNKPHPTVMQPPLQCVLQQHDHDHLTPPGGEKCNIHFWSATMPGFGTLALYHIYPHICRLSYPKS